MTLLAPLVAALALGGGPDLAPRLALQDPGSAEARVLERALAEDGDARREAEAHRKQRGNDLLVAAGAAALAGLFLNLQARHSEDPIEIGLAKVESYGFFIGSACIAAAALNVLGTDPPEATP